MKGGNFMRVILPILILGLAVGGFFYLRATKPETTVQPPEERIWTVATVPAVPEDVEPEIKVFGQIYAGRQVELRPLVEGRVIDTGPNFVEGGVVAKDDPLITIDPFDFENLVQERKAQLDEARARLVEIEAERAAAQRLVKRDEEQVALRRRDVERRERLSKRGVTSEKAVDDAKLALSEARQRLIERQRNIAQSGSRIAQQKAVIDRLEVQVRQAERDLEQTQLLAPFDGFLADVSTEVGKRVSRSDRVARLIDANRLEVRFSLSDENFGRLLAAGHWRGRKIRAVWSAGDVLHEFSATIDRIQGEVDAAKGGVDLFARIDSAGPSTPLRPGAFVEVWFKEKRYEKLVRIPESALHANSKIFLAHNGRLKAQEIKVMARSGNHVFIRG
ncbi:MAG TPA: HlyD family efflux transporter periplasmic adaptor subunit, partial [Alphaproteobacteria bacterium]|nr:HlyD family efflux transporter periplasmic adaptor subunit [Alphaproteobacteria bacterium]